MPLPVDLGDPRQAMVRERSRSAPRRSSNVSAASVRSSMSGPESSRLMTTDASRRIARSPGSSVRNGAISAINVGCSTRQSVRSTTSDDRCSCSPRMMRPAARRTAKSTRRRSPGRPGAKSIAVGRREARLPQAHETTGRISRFGSQPRASAAARSRRNGRNGGRVAQPEPRWRRQSLRRRRASHRLASASGGR